MVYGEGDGSVRAISGDFNHKYCVIILSGPGWNLCRIAAVVFDHIFCEFVKQPVFPGDKDHGILIWRFCEFFFQALDFSVTEFCVHGQATANSCGFDGCERTHVIVAARIHFLSRVWRKDKQWSAKFFQEDARQRERAIETPAGKLAKAAGRLFAMPDTNKSFDAFARRGLRADGNREEQEQCKKYIFHEGGG